MKLSAFVYLKTAYCQLLSKYLSVYQINRFDQIVAINYFWYLMINCSSKIHEVIDMLSGTAENPEARELGIN